MLDLHKTIKLSSALNTSIMLISEEMNNVTKDIVAHLTYPDFLNLPCRLTIWLFIRSLHFTDDVVQRTQYLDTINPSYTCTLLSRSVKIFIVRKSIKWLSIKISFAQVLNCSPWWAILRISLRPSLSLQVWMSWKVPAAASTSSGLTSVRSVSSRSGNINIRINLHILTP